MKVDRHGKAKILTPEEIELVFYEGLKNDRDRAISLSASTPPVGSTNASP